MTNSPSTLINNTSDDAPPDKRPGIVRRLQQDTLSWPVWLAIAYAGLVLPVLCHAMTFSSAPYPPPRWQSGDLRDQIGFVLSGSAGIVLYPLMLYPMVCLTLLLFREERFAGNYLVRFGIFTGLPVAAWYCIIVGLHFFDAPKLLSPNTLGAFLAWGIGIVTPFVAWAVIRGLLWLRAKTRIPWAAVFVVALLLAGAATLSGNGESVLAFPVGLYILSIIFGPYCCFDAYLAMTARLLWRYPQPVRFTILQLMAGMTWLAAFLAACRWAVILSLQEYSKLPLEPPDSCYVATAAARGHAGLVGSKTIRSEAGTPWLVNRQLAVLKAAELAMQTLTPRLHSRTRAIYDRLGPAIARRVTHPLLGDLAYLALKPFEWGAHLLLACLLGRERRRIDRLYLRDELHPDQ